MQNDLELFPLTINTKKNALNLNISLPKKNKLLYSSEIIFEQYG